MSKKNHHLSQAQFQAIVQVASNYRISEDTLREMLEIPRDGRVLAESVKRCVEYLIDTTGESNIPFLIGRAIELEYLNELGKILSFAKSFKDIILIMKKYHILVHSGISLEIARCDLKGEIELSLKYDIPQVQNIRYPAEALFASYFTLLREFISDKVQAKEICFFHKSNSDQKIMKEFYGCPIYFEKDVNKIVFDIKVFDLALKNTQATADESLLDLVESQVLEIHNETFETSLQRYLVSNLIPTPPSLEESAKYFNVSQRTLQYRLAKVNKSFKTLLNAIRHERAKELLGKELAISDVSFLLGFQNPSAFSKSFKVWSGLSPREYTS